MNTLDELRSFRDSPYGLAQTCQNFQRASSLHTLVDAKRDWNGIREMLDRWDETDWPVMSVMAAFRNAFIEAFEDMPTEIEECKETLSDAMVTLRTIEMLDAVTPFLRNEPPHVLVKKMEETSIEEKHIADVPTSVVTLEQECTKRWNERRKKHYLPPVDPLTATDVRHMLLGRDDTQGIRIHTRGDDDEVSGYAVVRVPYDDSDIGLDLIGWAADDERGYPDALASLLLLRLEYEARKRINFALRSPA